MKGGRAAGLSIGVQGLGCWGYGLGIGVACLWFGDWGDWSLAGRVLGDWGFGLGIN